MYIARACLIMPVDLTLSRIFESTGPISGSGHRNLLYYKNNLSINKKLRKIIAQELAERLSWW